MKMHEPSKLKTVDEAIAILRAGGIVIYPTDTAFGIGCRMDDRAAVDRLFALRRRPKSQAMPVLVASVDMALTYFLSPSDIVRHLMETYWPGALTIVAPCAKNRVYSPIRGGGNTIGLRMPDNGIALDLIRGVGVPLLGPSANFHGGATPYHTRELDAALVSLVDGVVEGSCSVNAPSTVVDTTVFPPKILRQGAVRIKMTLAIDTSDSKATNVRLEFAGRTIREERATTQKAQTVLPLIEKILAAEGAPLRDIGDIRVHTGPGSFTGLRVGMSVAQMLGMLLGVPVNGSRSSPHKLLYDDGGKFAMMDE